MSAVERVVRAECAASGSLRQAEIEPYDRYPLTDNDAEATERVARAFTTHFGDAATTVGRQTASEDVAHIPTALGVPATYWALGGVDPDSYRAAAERGTVSQDVPGNHSPAFAPVLRPTLETGTAAVVVAALARLG